MPTRRVLNIFKPTPALIAGGSGGPLLNSKGHVIGMITMASERGNMGFATPINVIKRILPRLANGDKFAWGWLGVQMSDISLEQAKQSRTIYRKGVVVSAVLARTTGGARRRPETRCDPFGQRQSCRQPARRGAHGRRTRSRQSGALTILRKGKTCNSHFRSAPNRIRPKHREG